VTTRRTTTERTTTGNNTRLINDGICARCGQYIDSAAKLKRIRKIINDYYRPPDERQTAPENIIEYINAVLKEQ
jgi:hypothetical protein